MTKNTRKNGDSDPTPLREQIVKGIAEDQLKPPEIGLDPKLLEIDRQNPDLDKIRAIIGRTNKENRAAERWLLVSVDGSKNPFHEILTGAKSSVAVLLRSPADGTELLADIVSVAHDQDGDQPQVNRKDSQVKDPVDKSGGVAMALSASTDDDDDDDDAVGFDDSGDDWLDELEEAFASPTSGEPTLALELRFKNWPEAVENRGIQLCESPRGRVAGEMSTRQAGNSLLFSCNEENRVLLSCPGTCVDLLMHREGGAE